MRTFKTLTWHTCLTLLLLSYEVNCRKNVLYRRFNGIDLDATFTATSKMMPGPDAYVACGAFCSNRSSKSKNGFCLGFWFDPDTQMCYALDGPLYRKSWTPGTGSFFLVQGITDYEIGPVSIIDTEFIGQPTEQSVHFSDKALYEQHGPITAIYVGGTIIMDNIQARCFDTWGPVHGRRAWNDYEQYYEPTFFVEGIEVTYNVDPNRNATHLSGLGSGFVSHLKVWNEKGVEGPLMGTNEEWPQFIFNGAPSKYHQFPGCRLAYISGTLLFDWVQALKFSFECPHN